MSDSTEMAEFRAKCTKKIPGQPEFIVGEIYSVKPQRTGPAGYKCCVMLPDKSSGHWFSSIEFDQYFERV